MSGGYGSTEEARDRLRDLTWGGFTSEEIAAACPLTVEEINGLYDAEAYFSDRIKRAVRHAWRTLIPDVDEVAVERFLDGDPAPFPLTRAEQHEVVRLLRRDRYSHSEIAERTGLNQRKVCRIVVADGLPLSSLLAEGTGRGRRRSTHWREPSRVYRKSWVERDE